MRRKKAKVSAESSGIVTSDAVQRKNHTLYSSRLPLVFLVVAIVIILGILGYAAWRTRVKTPATSSNGSNESAPIHTPQDNLKAAQNTVAGAQSTEDKVNAYLALGAAYMDTKQLPEAITAYKQADTLSSGQNLTALTQLCNIYNMMKQHDNLIATLQRIVALLQQQASADPSNYKAANQLLWYQDALRRVEAGGTLT
jgi:cytochrome c-type biogenesis protein CcmH/NrfG